ncbi:MAG: adenosylcobinamide-GDP ribazoletransferase [Pseudomonadota bacterium]
MNLPGSPDGLWLALRFLTRLPTPEPASMDARAIGASLAWYPVAGLVVALPVAAVSAGVAPVGGELLAAALAVATLVLVTGALHLDGVADTADAWVGGGGDPERTLAILKDTAIGPVGTAAIAALLLVKVAAAAQAGAAGLLVAVVLARLVPAGLLLTTPYLRPGGLGEALAAAPRQRTLGGLAATVLVLLVIDPLAAVVGLAAVVVAAGLLRAFLMRRLGGTTGDTVGAGVELGETAALVAVVLLAG